MTITSSQRIAIIMSGGSGERFWPLSRAYRPKQLLHLTGLPSTLLEQTIENISPVFPSENVFLAIGKSLEEPIKTMKCAIPDNNIIVEPMKRNTAGCLVFTAAQMLFRYGDSTDVTLAVLPSDHFIGDLEGYRAALDTALTVAENGDALVTIGISPGRPESGYGYLELGQMATQFKGACDDASVYGVKRFCEKPDIDTAREYVGSGNYLWNSGMFFWRLKVFLDELGSASPSMLAIVERLHRALKDDDTALLGSIFEELPNISIDYALMEKAKNVLAVKADFGWDDIGSWDALERTVPLDSNGNVAIGDPVLVDTKNCIVYNEPGADAVAVSVIGVEGLAVIVSRDGVLVVPKERSQDVRRAVEELKKRNAEQL